MTLLTKAGWLTSRYGLVLILIWYGLFKFTATEAAAIKPLLEHSPFMSWLLTIFGQQGASNLIGTAEILTALAIAARPLSPTVAYYGGLAGALIFAGTFSFLFTTPGTFTQPEGFWVPDGFLIKDLLLLGFCLLSAGEAAAVRRAPVTSAGARVSTATRLSH